MNDDIQIKGDLVSYRTAFVCISDDITSYADLFDPKYKNSEVLLDDFRVIIGLTAKSLGYNKVIWLKDWIDPDETNIHCITQQQLTCIL